MFFRFLLMLLFLSVFYNSAWSCSVFYASDGKNILAGNNEDYTDKNTFMWFTRQGPGEYGNVFFGFGNKFAQGGMNEQGLFFDGLATPHFEITGSLTKPDFEGILMRAAMEECSSVDEVIEMFSLYNLASQNMADYQLMVGDRFNSSAILEGDIILHKDKSYQVVTNFYQSNPELGYYPCPRYNKAVEMFEKNSVEISKEFFNSILNAVKQSITIYSNVYDLKNRIVYLFSNQNFNEFIKVDLREELKTKGGMEFRISELFSNIENISPGNEETINSNSVIIQWNGKTDSIYEIHYSKDPDFINDDIIEVDNSAYYALNFSGISFFCIGYFSIASGNGSKKQWILRILIPFLIIGFLSSCQNNEGDLDKSSPKLGVTEFSATIDNLQSDTTYYWKILAKTGDDFNSETIVRTLFTGN